MSLRPGGASFIGERYDAQGIDRGGCPLGAFMVTAEAAKKTGRSSQSIQPPKTFVCEWNKVSYTYKVTDKTSFRARGKGGDFSDVKVGVS